MSFNVETNSHCSASIIFHKTQSGTNNGRYFRKDGTHQPCSGTGPRCSGQSGSRVRSIRIRVLLGSRAEVPASGRSGQDRSRLLPGPRGGSELQIGLLRNTNHAEVVRVQFDPEVCPYTDLLSVFWARHDPTALNRQAVSVIAEFQLILYFWHQKGGDVGTQYRSGIYHYNENQARLAQESKEAKQVELKDKKVVTEILPAKRFYRAEEYHQQYLEKGGGQGNKQSAEKGCTDPIRCYG
ncbi:peptidemethionine sulfoxide reductase 1 [Prunus dulcis]|uniref:peptide-methionine (S)-S-oxide reductase n=1 Tax=Prunus dulcis TaxID=3755 RepID=A0A4Y1RHC1_PRUDU|nr:peptidemethionine sulfoxide reductase 1 [Prunus dulcis]